MRSAGGSRLAAALAALACAPIATAGPECVPVGSQVLLPRALQETSGVAFSAREPSTFWTHNDGGVEIFAIDREGRVVARHTLDVEPFDLEDMAVADCGAGSCLYLADTGDNAERRDAVRILRAPEPDPNEAGNVRLDVFPVRYPDGPRDAEAIFVLPGERVHLVSKGRSGAVTVFRYPGALRPDTVVLEPVQQLSDGAQSLLDQVTGASASATGRTVAVRTYQALRFYGVAGDTLVALRDGVVNLRPLEEIQGEGVALSSEGRVLLTAEGGPLGGPAALSELRCRIEAGAGDQ